MSFNVFYYSLLNRKTKSIIIETNEKIEDLRQKIATKEEMFDQNFKLYSNGKHLKRSEQLSNDCFIQIHLGLIGGKGGFGSMLRAIGAQIEKTTNREACRDLSGRRLRDVKDEQRVRDWVAKEDQRKRDLELKRKHKLERLAKQPNCEFNDVDFERTRAEIPDIVDEAVHYGLQQQLQQQSTSSTISGTKRKSDDQMVGNKLKKKKHSLWLGIDDIEEDSDESEEVEPNESHICNKVIESNDKQVSNDVTNDEKHSRDATPEESMSSAIDIPEESMSSAIDIPEESMSSAIDMSDKEINRCESEDIQYANRDDIPTFMDCMTSTPTSCKTRYSITNLDFSSILFEPNESSLFCERQISRFQLTNELVQSLNDDFEDSLTSELSGSS